ncbi:hypothetical protein A6764_14555 [Brevibacillus sp. WF146]|uniref:hypothetical protein n=1 Tax=Brevibacillus sp. WF146 TaxID=319501 RepID=UPI0007EDB13B|nr:hypothetical protein [Brevibacillus sp. WF146]UYZ12053.1 hypothetical protein A6764_14555 [Brevibacillus sp. WF146]
MNRINKKIHSLSLAFVLVASVGAYALAFQGDGNEGAGTSDANVEVKADSKPLNKNPEPILKGNADKLGLHSQSFKATKSSVLDENYLEEQNAEVKLTEYMTYEEFVKLAGDDAVSIEIAKDASSWRFRSIIRMGLNILVSASSKTAWPPACMMRKPGSISAVILKQ